MSDTRRIRASLSERRPWGSILPPGLGWPVEKLSVVDVLARRHQRRRMRGNPRHV
jgi:hypothetical protein